MKTKKPKLLTKAQVFHKVRAHLLKQKRKAVKIDGQGQYLAPNGDRCALGCLIPKSLYRPEIEGSDLYDLMNDHPDLLRACGLSGRLTSLLKTLQESHDECEPAEWPEQLTYVAKRYRIHL